MFQFPIGVIVFDEHELISFVSQGLTLSTANLVQNCRYKIACEVVTGRKVEEDEREERLSYTSNVFHDPAWESNTPESEVLLMTFSWN